MAAGYEAAINDEAVVYKAYEHSTGVYVIRPEDWPPSPERVSEALNVAREAGYQDAMRALRRFIGI